MPTHVRYGLGETMPPEDLRDVIRFTQQHRTAAGRSMWPSRAGPTGATPDRGAKHLALYVQAGLTWWIEALGWWLGTPADALTRVRQGPPVQPAGE